MFNCLFYNLNKAKKRYIEKVNTIDNMCIHESVTDTNTEKFVVNSWRQPFNNPGYSLAVYRSTTEQQSVVKFLTWLIKFYVCRL